MEIAENTSNSSKETMRIEAFSDGVFAIAITLLILEIHVPELKAGETLLRSLSHEWTSFLAFLIGFFTLLVCWINHHFMFQMIHRSNSVLSLLNGLKLLVVSITPFATALLSKHLQTAWSQTAINLYGLNFALMGASMTGIWCYAFFKGFATAKSKSVLRATTRLYIFAALLSASIWIVSYLNILISLILFGIMFLIFIFPEKIVKWQTNRIE